MTNGEKHIEKLLSWYKEAVTEDGVCYLTSDDKNTLAYAIKCCKHFEDIKKDVDSWMLREETSSSENPNLLENPISSTTKNDCSEQNGCITCSLDDGDDCCRKLYEESMQEPTTKDCLEVEQIVDEVVKKVMPLIRPKGHWTDDGYCSCCNNQTLPLDVSGYASCYDSFCPNCGAEMSEVEE